MDPMTMALVGQSAIGSLSDWFNKKSKNKKLKDAQKALQRQISDGTEINQAVNQTAQAYNSATANRLNGSASQLGLIRNYSSPLVQATVANQLLPQKIEAMQKTEMEIKDRNMQLESKIAELGMQKEDINPVLDWTKAIGNGAMSYVMGEEEAKQAKRIEAIQNKLAGLGVENNVDGTTDYAQKSLDKLNKTALLGGFPDITKPFQKPVYDDPNLEIEDMMKMNPEVLDWMYKKKPFNFLNIGVKK